ncbi:SRPBCC family protein [Nocardia transvalensis]|uniref:SRPBCC family protein n=1 Tax=Nocardia transvalensis TaxID=37333 RepID=UPI001893732F|nr:SRPBCC family protein [Nocardia transvalensis]MBF6328827.1 SRPBCC family protein [Nocardia transvalensis]
MGHIRYASDVGAPVEIAFTYTDNHLFVPDWMVGITAFDPVGDADHGPGAVYAASVRLGLWHTTVECEITEYRRNAVIGYTLRRRRPGKVAPAHSEPPPATLGILTLRFDPLGYARSVLTAEVDFRPPRGWLGRMGGTVIDAAVTSVVRRSESQLRREIEDFHGTDLVGRIA